MVFYIISKPYIQLHNVFHYLSENSYYIAIASYNPHTIYLLQKHQLDHNISFWKLGRTYGEKLYLIHCICEQMKEINLEIDKKYMYFYDDNRKILMM